MKNWKTILIKFFALIFSFSALSPLSSFAEKKGRAVGYPFDVTLGGQAAEVIINPGIYATIPKPVSPEAEMVLNAEPGMIIVNIIATDEKADLKNVDQSKAMVILAQNSNKVKLSEAKDSSMQKKAVLKPGWYLMNIVMGSKGTSRIHFRVGDGSASGGGTVKMSEKENNAMAIDQSKPESVVAAIFTAAKTGEFTTLAGLLPPSGKCDGDVKNVCGVGNANDKARESFIKFFEKGKIVGEAKISPDGNRAAVDFLFGPKGTKPETMNLVKEGGKWYLGSF